MHIFSIFILLFSLSSFADQGISEFINIKSIKPSRADEVTADHVFKFYKIVKQGYITEYILDKTIEDVKRSQNFYFFYPWLNDLKKIVKTSSVSDLIQLFTEFKTEKETHYLLRHLRTRKLVITRRYILEKIGNNILKSNTIEPLELDFIKKNILSMVKGNSRRDFVQLMQKIKKQETAHGELSNFVKKFLIDNKIPLRSNLIASLQIDAEFSKYIQDQGLTDSRYQGIIEREFIKTNRTVYQAIEDKLDSAIISSMIKKLLVFSNLDEFSLSPTFVLPRLNDLAKSLQRNKYEDLADYLLKIGLTAKQADIKDDALFYLAWRYLRNGDYKKALSSFENNTDLDHWEKITDARVKFWIAYCYENTDEIKTAEKIYSNIIHNHPLNYYAIISSKRINSFKNNSSFKNFYQESAQSNGWTLTEKDLEKDHISSLIRIQIWSKMQYRKFLDAEVNSLLEINNKFPIEKSTDLYVLTCRLVAQNFNFLESFKIIYKGLDLKRLKFNRATLESLYPKPYFKDVTQALSKESIDPIIVLSLIRQESVFNPEAKSIVGARGLMQLMPQTAKRLKKHVRPNQLENPKLNIELGSKYITSLFKKYDQNLVYILASYNAGEARVKKWQEIYFESESILHNIETIPFLETRNYVKLIFRNIFFYKVLEDKKDLADPAHHNRIYDVHLGFSR